MKLLTGTSGYSYKEWKGSFYPEDLPASQMLAFYGKRFPTVEINNTFYRLPKEETLVRWAEEVPPGFVFVLKVSRRITHQHRLKREGAEQPLGYLLDSVQVLGPKLGPLLFQLPPNFKQDLPRLQEFLELLPPGCRAVFEFRHASWFEEPVYGLLRTRGIAVCLADAGPLDETPELVSTGTWGYLRLRREEYADAELLDWVDLIRAQPWQEVYVFFKHEDQATGPKLAERFNRLWDLQKEGSA